MVNVINNLSREFRDFERLFLPKNKIYRQLVFYSENSIYYRYFQDYIEYILNKSEIQITYITSDPQDEIFTHAPVGLHPYYIKNLLSLTLSRLDAKVLVLTVPDLNKGIFKRAPETVHQIYAFHSISSTHYRHFLGAFDHYDTIFCVGQYHIDEIRKTEALYGLRPKHLLLTGYPLVERLYRQHIDIKSSKRINSNTRPTCLIAPSCWWFPEPSSIMDELIDEMIEILNDTEYDVLIRPHPEYFKRFKKRVEIIERRVSKTKNIKLQIDLSSFDCLHQADLLITDQSGISMEYFIATERPVLLIDIPMPQQNPEAQKLNLEPIEDIFRSKIGMRLSPNKIDQLPTALASLLAQQSKFVKGVPEIRNALIANWQKAAQVGGDYILSKCSEI